jgi:ABC-2 type transport system ATP-binding protein
MNPLVETHNLHRRYGRTEALAGVDLTIERGMVFGLVGPNGAGKSTLVKTLMNIVEPTRGRAEVLGVDSRQLSAPQYQQIGYVSENQEMPEWMTVDYLMRYLAPFYPSWDAAMAHDLLTRFELPRDRKIRHLSRGMRMKVALVSSLSYRPELLVLDEPFSGLDPLVREEFLEGLIDAAQETTMLISSHDLGEIETFASHVGFLDQGRLRFAQNLEELSDRFREVQISLPTSSSVPTRWPAHWIGVQTSPTSVRFVDAAYEPERVAAEVAEVFGLGAQVDVAAMSLRAIFVVLARQTRNAA